MTKESFLGDTPMLPVLLGRTHLSPSSFNKFRTGSSLSRQGRGIRQDDLAPALYQPPLDSPVGKQSQYKMAVLKLFSVYLNHSTSQRMNDVAYLIMTT